MEIKEMPRYLGVSISEFARRYRIPLRTVQEWMAGRRTPPPYMVELLERAVVEDKKTE